MKTIQHGNNALTLSTTLFSTLLLITALSFTINTNIAARADTNTSV